MAGGLICASPAYAGHAVGEEQGRDPSWDQPIATGGIQNAFRFCAGRSDVALFGSRVILVVDRRSREMEVPVASLKKPTRKLGRRTAMAPKMGSEELAKIALGLMAERHFASVPIKDIASAAKVTGAMIYYHFKDKEQKRKSVVKGKSEPVRV